MKSIDEMAKLAFDGRKRLEVEEKETEEVILYEEDVKSSEEMLLEEYTKEIINIFIISNDVKNARIRLKQLRLQREKNKECLVPTIAFEEGEKAAFYPLIILKTRVTGDSEELLKAINNLQIPESLLEDLYEYFARKLPEKEFYFEDSVWDCTSKHYEVSVQINSEEYKPYWSNERR
jgi:hypothetical protein